jgi:sugar lactone lactonase YvrE
MPAGNSGKASVTTSATTIELVLDARAELGEGPIWDADRARLLFVDIMRGQIHEFDPVSGRDRVVDVGQPVGAVAPTVRGDWVAATKTGFFRVDPDTGTTSLMAHVEADIAHTRMNDGYVDARGRFWAGTMGMGGRRECGALYRLDPDGTVTCHVTAVSISNGIDWTIDGRRMYHVDTVPSRIDLFDFDEAAGTLSNRRVFATLPESSGYPDGLIVDAEDHLWVALWEGGALRRYRADGSIERTIELPVSLVTKCAFGGADLSDLYITTAWIELDEAGRAREPQAGGVFRCRPGVRGKPAHRFGG